MEIRPNPLQQGDVVRIVSPASRPEERWVDRCTNILERWGLTVELGRHVFSQHGFLAGTDEERAADFNDAVRSPTVRAIIASRGGKGSYRLVDLIEWTALRRDPKFVVGFSDVTALHFAIWNHCQIVSLHGGLFGGAAYDVGEGTQASLRSALLNERPEPLVARVDEPTSVLTSDGVAQGRLLGGNLSIVGTSAGWLLPDLKGSILLIEAIDMGPGLIDRTLQMLRRGGHLEGIAGVAIGQFEQVNFKPPLSAIDLLREHLGRLNVPIVGGLPIGHGHDPSTVPLGRVVRLDADRQCLSFET
ncbi:MAG: LD-carboxypeptidase [Pseudomonadota bacterium]